MPGYDAPCPKLRGIEPRLLQHWLRLPEEHHVLLGQPQEPVSLLHQLCDRGLWPEATRLLAYALPEREAVWWSCMCVRHTAADLPGSERLAIEAAEAWVRRPEMPQRREAALAASASGYAAAGAWSALGAAWSQRAPLLPDLCGGRGAATAVARAAVRDGAGRRIDRLRRFIRSGVDVANGGAGQLPQEENP
jgi:hypothetical protein